MQKSCMQRVLQDILAIMFEDIEGESLVSS